MIELAGVTFAYGKGKDAAPVLRDVTLTIAPGRRVALLGHNGSGKSTLARLIAGVHRPTRGTVRVDGDDSADPQGIWEIRRRVGIVFQNPDDQIVTDRLVDEVAFGPENLGLPRATIAERVSEVMDLLEIAPFAERPISELTLGQRQRVAIAGVLAMRPRYLVLDEPTTMLSPHLARRLLDAISALVTAQGLGVIIITHHMDEVVDFERCLVIDTGQLVMDGTPREVFGEIDRMRALGLDVPAVTELGRRLARRGFPVPANALTDREIIQPLALLHHHQSPDRAIPTAPDGPRVPTPPILETREAKHTYMRGTPYAQMGLDGASLSIPDGGFVAIVGPTRSGKSTLADCLNGIIRLGPGMVWFRGGDIARAGFDLEALRFAVGVVYQQPEMQILKDIVGKDVAFGPRRQGVGLAESRDRVKASLDAVGLPYEIFRDRYTYALSGGEKRRVAIAGVLAMRPRVLVLDEPTAGLDPRGRRAFLDLIGRLHRETGITVVYLTTSLADVIDLATHCYILDAGRVVASGAVDQVLADIGTLETLEIGLAATTRFILALTAAEPEFRSTAHNIDALEHAIIAQFVPLAPPMLAGER